MSDETQEKSLSGWSTTLTGDRKLFVSESIDHPYSDSGKGRLVSFDSNGQTTQILLSDETVKALNSLWRYARLRDRLSTYCWLVWASVAGRD